MTCTKGEKLNNNHSRRKSTPTLALFYSQDYDHDTPECDTLRKAGWIAQTLQERPIPGTVLVRPEPLTAEQVQQVHDPQYVTALRTGNDLRLAETSGIEWLPTVWKSVCASSGGLVSAALHAFQTKQNAGSLSAGIHHARAASGGPLCTLNALALAARRVLDDGAERVVIIDVDGHCGGGTYSIVRDWPGVVHLDIAVNDFDAYEPKPGTLSTLDIAPDAADYLPTLQKRLAALDGERFDLVLLGAGVDCHQGNGGPSGMTFQLLAEREATIFGWAAARELPVAFTLLGGYQSRELSAEAVARLHRLAIAAAGIANGGGPLEVNDIMEAAATQNGTEGFSYDSTGRKTDAAFHGELLADDVKPWDIDGDAIADMTDAELKAYLARRDRLMDGLKE